MAECEGFRQIFLLEPFRKALIAGHQIAGAWPLIFLLAFSALTSGCVTNRIPLPQESALFHTLTSGFSVNAREGTVRYAVTLEPRAPLEEPLYLRAKFENPADPDHPHLESVEAVPGEDYIFLESSPLEGLRAGRVYRIDIDILAGEEDEEPADTHTLFIRSILTTRS